MQKILIVEDEDILRESYRMVLSHGPYEVTVARNGKIALELCAETTYDLILLDLMMPIVDGVKFLQKFTSDPKHSTRIIILSNLSSGVQLDQALKLGAHKNVLKADLSPRQLLDTVTAELKIPATKGVKP